MEEIKITPQVQWAVVCDGEGLTSVHNTYQKALEKKKFLDEEYKGECKHKIYKVMVTLINKIKK